MAIKPHTLNENAFAKAESNMKLTPAGNGGFEFDLHGPAKLGKLASGKVQSPAQHASVKKAAAASVAKRRGSKFGGGL